MQVISSPKPRAVPPNSPNYSLAKGFFIIDAPQYGQIQVDVFLRKTPAGKVLGYVARVRVPGNIVPLEVIGKTRHTLAHKLRPVLLEKVHGDELLMEVVNQAIDDYFKIGAFACTVKHLSVVK